jgi:hypothetical protein
MEQQNNGKVDNGLEVEITKKSDDAGTYDDDISLKRMEGMKRTELKRKARISNFVSNNAMRKVLARAVNVEVAGGLLPERMKADMAASFQVRE